MRIQKIVVTGGPCAGKTTGMSWIQNTFSKLGYTVLVVPETATELISGGVTPWTCGTNVDYQKCQMRLQLEKERLFEQAARTMKVDKLLIVCDRGAMDNRAYMDEQEFAQVLADIGATEEELRNGYDAVFHMVTAAKGAEGSYTTENNSARYETVEEAAAMDDRFIAAWTGHPHLRVIDNSTSFEDKLRRLIGEIRSFLGETEPMEFRRKFLVEYPDISWLESYPGCRKQDIEQIYLLSREEDELRVRRRGEDGVYTYYKTLKRYVSDTARLKMEVRLTEAEYAQLLMEADPRKRPIRKKRYCLTCEGQFFEIDIYPFWNDKAIAEVDLSREDEPVRFPEELKVILEVTGDKNYRIAALASLDRQES